MTGFATSMRRADDVAIDCHCICGRWYCYAYAGKTADRAGLGSAELGPYQVWQLFCPRDGRLEAAGSPE
jgi:hypothetical protein